MINRMHLFDRFFSRTMTELLFHTDSYIEEFEAGVVAVLPKTNGFVSDRTAFSPDGGTHVANTRKVGSIRITGHKSKGKIKRESSWKSARKGCAYTVSL